MYCTGLIDSWLNSCYCPSISVNTLLVSELMAINYLDYFCEGTITIFTIDYILKLDTGQLSIIQNETQ